MHKTVGRYLVRVSLIGSLLMGCSTHYTQADLDEAERREDASVRAEAVIDEEIGEAGGSNMEALEEEREEINRKINR